MTEGSVIVEGVDTQDASDSTEVTESQDQGASQESPSETQDTSQDSTVTSTDQDTQLTEKGTKLDPNPMSALNQQLANERAKRSEYERLLNDPKALKNYVAQFDTEKPEEKPEEFDVSKVESVEDLQKVLSQQDKRIQQKVQELDSTIKGLEEKERIEAVSNIIRDDVTAVREKYPELNPNSDSYDKNLEEFLGFVFEKADFDPEAKLFRGQTRLTEVADKVMKLRGSAKQEGSKEAQTIVKDRRKGAVVAGGKDSAPDESNMTPTQIIASRMQRASGN